jgi:hypothetical protein
MLVGFGFWRFFPIEWGVSLASGVLVAATIVSVVQSLFDFACVRIPVMEY